MPLWSNAPPATKLSQRASAAALSPPSIASGESPAAARMALMFPARPVCAVAAVDAPPLLRTGCKVEWHRTITHTNLCRSGGYGFLHRGLRGFCGGDCRRLCCRRGRGGLCRFRCRRRGCCLRRFGGCSSSTGRAVSSVAGEISTSAAGSAARVSSAAAATRTAPILCPMQQ